MDVLASAAMLEGMDISDVGSGASSAGATHVNAECTCTPTADRHTDTVNKENKEVRQRG